MCLGVKRLTCWVWSILPKRPRNHSPQTLLHADKCSLQQLIIIPLIGLNVIKPEVKWQAVLSLFACTWGGGHVCRARPFILPVQLPEASHLSVPDLTRTERKRETTDRKGNFFFSSLPPPSFSFSEVNRMSAPLTFHRAKQLFIRARTGATESGNQPGNVRTSA